MLAAGRLAQALATCEKLESVVLEFCIPKDADADDTGLARIVEAWLKSLPKTCVTIGLRITLTDEYQEAEWELHARSLWHGWVDVGRTLHDMPQLKALYIDLPTGFDPDMECQWSRSLIESAASAIEGEGTWIEDGRLFRECGSRGGNGFLRQAR